jgi:hypothetical protein
MDCWTYHGGLTLENFEPVVFFLNFWASSKGIPC